MPTIYLSPSTQEANLYVNGGTEEFYMNKIADAMVPYLRANAIQFDRNTPDMTAGSSIRASNSGNYDFHLALHSNAAPEGKYGTVRGTDVYYYPGSAKGAYAAGIFADNLRDIYPLPEKVRALPTTRLGEVKLTRAPSVLIEFAYHDNPEDAQWIKDNIEPIAKNVVLSLTEYFDIPFAEPVTPRKAVVKTAGGNLNLRAKPSPTARIKTSIPNGSPLTIYGETGDWYVVQYEDLAGYVKKEFVR